MTIFKVLNVTTFKVINWKANVRFPLFSIAAGEGKCPRETAAGLSVVCLEENPAPQRQTEVGEGPRDIYLHSLALHTPHIVKTFL